MTDTPGVAVVTGGSTGIGLAISRRLADLGRTVVMGVLPERQASAVTAAESCPEGRCVALEVDVRDSRSVRLLSDKVHDEFGSVDVLVNNAGVDKMTPFLDIDDAEWRWMLETHLDGAFHCAREFLPGMVESGRGCIVNVASELALIGRERQAHYVAAKSGLVGLTKALAREFGPLGIRVNAVAPGPTLTDMLGDEERRSVGGQLPLRRIGRPDDTAAVVAFLCSDDADWITGQIWSPNGGAVI